jgi:mercuric reductase
MQSFDFLILGAGASAFAAAIKANELGTKTAMVKGPLPLGGTCVNVGCVPSKSLVRAAELVHLARTNPRPGVELSLSRFDFAEVIRSEQRLVEALRHKKYELVMEQVPSVTVFEGNAEFLDGHRVRVGPEELRAERILIATGSTALPPPVPGLAEAGYLTHITALATEHLPGSLLVLGGGAVGLEFAQIYARFGTKVTLAVRGKRLFTNTEPELSHRLEQIFLEEGISVLKEAEAIRVDARGDQKVVAIRSPAGERTFEFDHILVATGKTPNSESLKLGRAGVEVNARRAVVTTPTYQTSAPHIYATGDVTNLPRRLETTAGREGSFAAENALRGTSKAIDYTTVPWTVFTDPQLAGIGLLDSEVAAQGLSCTCNTISFDHVAKAHILGDTRGISKMIADRKTGRIVGVHILGSNAGETINQAELILKNKMTIEQILGTLPVFPTLSESLKINALSLVTDVSKLSCCV